MNAPGYRTIELLRRGRDLDVYDVWSEERACRCVIKALRPDRLDRDGARRRLLEEGRLLRDLTHPHIVRAYEVAEEPVPMVVMETLTGETVGHMIPPLPVATPTKPGSATFPLPGFFADIVDVTCASVGRG